MGEAAKKSIIAMVAVLALIACAMLIRWCSRMGAAFPGAALVRSAIYIALAAAWGFSVHMRIVQTQLRRCLTEISALMVLWLLLRTVKYSVDSADAARLLWYFYYLPMLFIPLLALFVSMSLGRAEDYRLPRRAALLYVPAALLLLLVVTNDLHRLVFSFPGALMTDASYEYAPGYYPVLAWELGCAAASFIIMLSKCRLPHRRTFLLLPLVPLALSVAYAFAYMRGVRWVWVVAGDITVTQCLLYIGIFESCIRCGLIESNLGYDELLKATSIPVHITDEHLRTLHRSAAARPQSEAELARIAQSGAVYDRGSVYRSHRLRRGFVFWQEDVSELNAVSEELELVREELLDTGDILKAENAQRERLLRLEAENRLYGMVERQTARQLEMLRERLERIRSTDDAELAGRLLAQIIVIGTYIKRRSNLSLVGVQRGSISAQELLLCLNESAENLRLYGTECAARVDEGGQLTPGQAAAVYDLFEAVIETGLEALRALLICAQGGATPEVRICADCDAELSALAAAFPSLELERDADALQHLTLSLEGL